MGALFFLLPLVLALVAIAVIGFLWALRNGQMDDLETPSVRILFDEESERINKPSNEEEKK